MSLKTDSADPAAIFACAVSLRDACERVAEQKRINLSEAFHGVDQFWREVMRIAAVFESWACAHVAFEELGEVWPYFLEERFGNACLRHLEVKELATFDENGCLEVAAFLELPLRFDEKLGLPLDVRAANPAAESFYTQFAIQAVREHLEDHEVERVTWHDEAAYDENYGPPFLGLYGLPADGLPEHIKDFGRYADAVRFAAKIAPGIVFPDVPVVRNGANAGF